MKYFTKEWYEACQAADWCLNMAVSKNAEEFSEEYYKDLYTRRRRAFVKQMKEEEGEAFDKIAAEVAFMKHHEATVKRMERILPIEIKAAVADMRVLALDIATKEVRHQLKVWCEEQKKLADAKEAEYAADSTKLSCETFTGCELTGVEMKETTLTLTLKGNVKKAVFKNYKILKQEGYLLGAKWLKEEAYAAEGGKEYHVLFRKSNGTLGYLTIFAEQLTILK